MACTGTPRARPPRRPSLHLLLRPRVAVLKIRLLPPATIHARPACWVQVLLPRCGSTRLPPRSLDASSQPVYLGVHCGHCRRVYTFQPLRSQAEVAAMTNLLMNRTRSRLLHFLGKSGPSTLTQISAGIGLSPSAVRKHLSVLVSSGCVEVSRHEHARKTVARYSANAERIRERSADARLLIEREEAG